MVMYFILKPDMFELNYLKTEIIYMFKYFYFPIVGVCLINCYDHLGFSKEKLFKIFIYNILMMSILIIIDLLLNIYEIYSSKKLEKQIIYYRKATFNSLYGMCNDTSKR